MTERVIKATINGQSETFDAETTIGDLVDRLDRGRAGVAVARNREVVPRSVWDDTPIMEADEIEVLSAVQGG